MPTVVPEVRKDERDDLGRAAGGGEPPGLDARKGPANGVQLGDRSPCGHQKRDGARFVREGESFHRCRHQAGAAPRKEDEKEVRRVEAAGEGEGGRSRLETPLVRNRVAGANEATSGRKTLPAVVRGRHDERLVDPSSERRLGRAGHRHGPLADGQKSHPRRDEDELRCAEERTDRTRERRRAVRERRRRAGPDRRTRQRHGRAR